VHGPGPQRGPVAGPALTETIAAAAAAAAPEQVGNAPCGCAALFLALAVEIEMGRRIYTGGGF